jgi:uncharacterized protein DUF3887
MALLATHLIGALVTQTTTAPAPPLVDIVAAAQAAFQHLERAEYSAVTAMFSAKLREKLSEAKVRQTWEGMHRKTGGLQRIGAPVTATKDNLRRVIVPADFEKSKMEIEFAFNTAGEIAGLLRHRK